MDKIREFQNELKALLTKYEATITWTCSSCSDLHGIYQERMIADVIVEDENGKRREKTVQLSDMYSGYIDKNMPIL